MSACAHDGKRKIVPLAVGISMVESKSHWMYFLRNLSTSIPEITNDGMVSMHDREKRLYNSQIAPLPKSQKSICVFDLEKNVEARFKSNFKGKIWAADKEYKDDGLQAALSEIELIERAAVTYLRNSYPKL